MNRWLIVAAVISLCRGPTGPEQWESEPVKRALEVVAAIEAEGTLPTLELAITCTDGAGPRHGMVIDAEGRPTRATCHSRSGAGCRARSEET